MPPRPPSDDSDEQSSDDELTDWPPTDSGQPDSNPPWILLGVGGLVAVAIGWFFRPWLHGLIYTVYTTPLLLLGIVAGSVAAWVTARSGGRVEIVVNTLSSSDHTITPLRVGVVVLVIAAVALMPVANAVAGVTLSDQTMSQTATAERLDDVDADNPRIVTRAVADRYASNTLNRPQYRVGDTDISVVNGTPYWAAPLAPDGLFNTITKRQAGTVLVDMTTQQANIYGPLMASLRSGLERFSIGTTGGNSSNRRRISLTTAIPRWSFTTRPSISPSRTRSRSSI